MTTDEANELRRRAAVMIAAAEGKEIEIKMKYEKKWLPSTGGILGWAWDAYDYRAKPDPPKPREVWIGFDHHGAIEFMATSGEGNKPLVLFREVLPGPTS